MIMVFRLVLLFALGILSTQALSYIHFPVLPTM